MSLPIVRVLVADDQPLMRDGIASLLARQPDLRVVAQAANGQEAIAQAVAVTPDVILMDIRMPVLDGIRATEAIIKAQPDVKVLMLTTFDDDDYIVQSLRAGAIGYILKDMSSDELADSVRLAYRGVFHFDARAGQKLALLMKRARSSAPDDTVPAPLTERERAVLLWVARGRSNQEIGTELNISEGTVKNHISSILAQLHLRDRIQLIIYAYERGLVG